MRAGCGRLGPEELQGRAFHSRLAPGLLQLLLTSHWKAQSAESPEANITFPREDACPCPQHPPFACVDFGAARVSSTPARSSWDSGRCAGCGVRRPLKPLPDVLGRPAPRLARGSSRILLRQSACKSFRKQGSAGGNDSKLEKSRLLEGEFPPRNGSKVNFARAEVEELSSH